MSDLRTVKIKVSLAIECQTDFLDNSQLAVRLGDSLPAHLREVFGLDDSDKLGLSFEIEDVND